MDFNIIKATPYLFKCFAELIFLTRFRHISFRLIKEKSFNFFWFSNQAVFLFNSRLLYFSLPRLLKALKLLIVTNQMNILEKALLFLQRRVKVKLHRSE